MKRLVRHIVALLLVAGLAAPVAPKARAQFVVTDPGNQAQSIMNAFMQLAEMLNQTGILDSSIMPDLLKVKQLFDEELGVGSDYYNLMQVVQNARYFKQLLEMYNTQMKYLYNTLTDVSTYTQYGLNYSMAVTPILNQATGCTNTLLNMMKVLEEIMKETGLTKGEKKEILDNTLKMAEQDIVSKRVIAEYEMATIKQSISCIQALNYMLGQEPSNGVDNIVTLGKYESPAGSVGDEYKSDVDEVSEGSVSLSSAVSDSVDMSNLSTAMRNAFSIIAIIMGLLAAMSVLMAYIRYTRGDYGAGDYGSRGFVRIAVACFVFALVFSILTKCAG